MSNLMRPHHHQLFSSFLNLKSEYELQKCFSLKDLSWVNWKFENIGYSGTRRLWLSSYSAIYLMFMYIALQHENNIQYILKKENRRIR